MFSNIKNDILFELSFDKSKSNIEELTLLRISWLFSDSNSSSISKYE